MRRNLLWLSCLLLVCLLPTHAAASEPWTGKSQDDVIALLGEPDKVKESDGTTELTYKLVRLEEGAVPPVGMRVLGVPGIEGTIGTMTPAGAADGTVSIRPTELDRRGRGTGGGVETDESYSVTWNPKDKKIERSWEERPAIRGKLTLRFELDESGTITGWSASPKKAMRRSD